MAKRFNIAVNMYNFQWTFPEMVADELGLFAKQGLEVKWGDVTPAGTADKAALYTELLRSRKPTSTTRGSGFASFACWAPRGPA